MAPGASWHFWRWESRVLRPCPDACTGPLRSGCGGCLGTCWRMGWMTCPQGSCPLLCPWGSPPALGVGQGLARRSGRPYPPPLLFAHCQGAKQEPVGCWRWCANPSLVFLVLPALQRVLGRCLRHHGVGGSSARGHVSACVGENKSCWRPVTGGRAGVPVQPGPKAPGADAEMQKFRNAALLVRASVCSALGFRVL